MALQPYLPPFYLNPEQLRFSRRRAGVRLLDRPHHHRYSYTHRLLYLKNVQTQVVLKAEQALDMLSVVTCSKDHLLKPGSRNSLYSCLRLPGFSFPVELLLKVCTTFYSSSVSSTGFLVRMTLSTLKPSMSMISTSKLLCSSFSPDVGNLPR